MDFVVGGLLDVYCLWFVYFVFCGLTTVFVPFGIEFGLILRYFLVWCAYFVIRLCCILVFIALQVWFGLVCFSIILV